MKRAAFALGRRFEVIKSELVERLPSKTRVSIGEIARSSVPFFAEITAAMARGDRVELRGFGSFFAKFREARTGQNPRTGALVLVGRKAVPFFRTGKEMKSRL